MSTTANFIILFAIVFFIFRTIQRLYYLLKPNGQHKSYLFQPSYSPKTDLESFFITNNIKVQYKQILSRDGVILNYRIIGSGPKLIYLANGLAADLFMFYPILRQLIRIYPNIFNEITLYTPSYRGIFNCFKNDTISTIYKPEDAYNVYITMNACGNDVLDIMKDNNINKFDCIICWSLGTQMILTLAASTSTNQHSAASDSSINQQFPTTITNSNNHHDITDKLFLLNPCTGYTLHYVLQTFFPLPYTLRKVVCTIITSILHILKILLSTYVWDILKYILESYIFLLILECLSFFGGFPPEQPPYFQQYLRDVFSSRYHTRGLLDLILALDEPCTTEAVTLPHSTVILSGYPDSMTGVYLAYNLAKSMKNSKHVVFTMASHFLLIEWPEIVAEELLKFIF